MPTAAIDSVKTGIIAEKVAKVGETTWSKPDGDESLSTASVPTAAAKPAAAPVSSPPSAQTAVALPASADAPDVITVFMLSDFCRDSRIIHADRYRLFTARAHCGENPLQMENPVQLLPVTPSGGDLNGQIGPSRRDLLMEQAKSLEASFLSEMLSHAGLDAAEGAFSGGVGEEQFASFLREAQAKSIVEHGGIGLAEHLFQSLVRKDNGTE